VDLAATISIYAGGPGSGCNPAAGHCGRTVTLYHGTTVANAKKILKQGFKAGRSHWETKTAAAHGKGRVYFSKKLRDAFEFGYSSSTKQKDFLDRDEDKGLKYAVIRTDVPQELYAKMKKDYENPGEWRVLKGTLSPEHITHAAIYKVGTEGAWKDKHVVDLKGDHKTLANYEHGNWNY
jgi:hypothetical protein